jgi:hypothetical protein
MNQPDRSANPTRSFSARISGAVGMLVVLGLLAAVPASATYEQVGTFDFAASPSTRYEAAKGLEANTTGAGGVAPGTLYAVTPSFSRVAVYSPKGEFREAWGWGVADGAKEFQRCGPDGEAAHPTCDSNSQAGWGGEGDGQLWSPVDVAVDQATGNVYVLNSASLSAGYGGEHGVVQVFSADGSQLIGHFGERAEYFFAPETNESINESPEKFHSTDANGINPGIAVDGSGRAYVSDNNFFGAREPAGKSRLMIFEPQSPGDYEHYVYAGQSHDITSHPYRPVVDSAGNLYSQRSASTVEKSTREEPDVAVCEFTPSGSGVAAMTVNPATGEVFFFALANKKIHQLGPCSSGQFVETTSFSPTPKAGEISALAFNPNLTFAASRPPGTLYAAENDTQPEQSGGPGGSLFFPHFAYIFAPAEVNPPVVESESVASVTSSTATLGAQINPKGSPTRYAFQYLTDAAYEANEPADRFAGSTEAPLGATALGSGQSALGAGASLVGLLPDTEYRYRVIATSHCEPDDEEAICEATGPAQIFRTFPLEAPGLSDNRAYELVSPAQKYGGEVFPADAYTASCGLECKPDGGGNFPHQSSPDGEAVVYAGFPFSFAGGARVFNEYLSRRTSSGWQTTILSPKLQSTLGGHKAFNAELTQGLFSQGNPSLSPDAPSEFANFYTQPSGTPSALTPLLGAEPPNRSVDNFELTYVGGSADFNRFFFEANDALTEETPFAPAALDPGASTNPTTNNLYEWSNGQLRLVNVLPGNAESVPGAAFGARPEDSQVGGGLSHAISADGSRAFWSDKAGQVYVRENGESTRAIPDPGKFLGASADGSKVLLQSGHVYDLETEAITDLSEGKGGFRGIVGQSEEDLSHIYFVDTAVLTGEGENDQGAKAQAGQNNLYAWQEGASTFVTTLLAVDNNTTSPSGYGGDWFTAPSHRTAEASPNGRWVAFLSAAPLTGYDNTCTIFNFNSGKDITGPCLEVFLYDSATGKLSCPSCNPSGARALGPSSLRLIRTAKDPLPQPRYLTDEGRLYFDSRDSLTPFDTNNGVEDVYQYEPNGIGSCKREAGCVSLISAGSEPVDSNLLTVDETGKNVFFTSRDQLVLKDRDDLLDLYVSRENGGLASESETSRGECQGEACQAAIVPPNDPTPGSSSFEGAGNVDEKKQAKKHKKKHKHAKKHKSHKRSHGRAANHNRGGAK